MPAWLPALKVVLPYLSHIVTAAAPVFTARREAEKTNDLTAQQIAELQKAVSSNAESLKVLAEQLKRTVTAVDEGSVSLEQRLERLKQQLAAQASKAVDLEKKIAERQPHTYKLQLMTGVALVLGAAALGLALVGLAR